MAKEIKKQDAPESAKWLNSWTSLREIYRFSPLGNEIGAVGDEEDPDASKQDTEDDWEVSPIGEEKEEVSEKESPDDKKSADDAQKKDEKEVEDKGKKKEGDKKDEKTEEKKAGEEEKKAGEKTETEEVEEDEPTEREAQLTAELGQAKKQAEFYSTKYNELLGEPEEESEDKTKVQAEEEPTPKKEVSKDVVKPGDWESQEQTAAYFEDRMASVAKESTRATKIVEAELEYTRKELNVIREHLIKFIHPDYDEVAERSWADVFELDDKGKISTEKVKSGALLRYFKENPFPQLAVYEYGLAKQAPKKIKEGIKKQTEKTLEKIEKKPKGATQPDAGDTTTEVTSLDWDTPQAEADKQLKKDGLI